MLAKGQTGNGEYYFNNEAVKYALEYALEFNDFFTEEDVVKLNEENLMDNYKNEGSSARSLIALKLRWESLDQDLMNSCGIDCFRRKFIKTDYCKEASKITVRDKDYVLKAIAIKEAEERKRNRKQKLNFL